MTISKTFFRTINHFHTETKLRLTYEQKEIAWAYRNICQCKYFLCLYYLQLLRQYFRRVVVEPVVENRFFGYSDITLSRQDGQDMIA